ncbi:MAG: glycosyltransferase [Microbacteriaceae bacterium]
MVSRDSVAVVVVARRHTERLAKTLSSLRDQVSTSAIVVANLTGSPVTVPAGISTLGLDSSLSLSEAVTAAMSGREGELIWILRDDVIVRVGALGALLNVVDTSPSVGVVGPKQLDAEFPAEIREMGESISRSGFAVQLAEREMDQGQYDRNSDVLGVGEAGMLVRRSIWDELRGFDPALPFVDGALDFCYRARASGWRVEIVPSATVETGDSSIEAHLGEISDARAVSEEAKARAHRVLSYISALVAPIRGLTLLFGAIARSVGNFAQKRANPFADLSGTFAGVVRVGRIAQSRRNGARTAKQRIDRSRLFVTRTEMARRRALERDARRAQRESADIEPRLGFGQLGAWMTAAAGVVGLVLGHQYFGASALSGGGLIPLSGSILDVWSVVGGTWTPIDGGLASAPEGFGVLVATLATLTWWDPNAAIVGLWLFAIPLSFVAGWVGAGAVTVRSSTAFVIATTWTLLPSLHVALAEGRLGAVLAHIAIPFAIRALLSRGAVSAGWYALLAAAIWVSVPALAPVVVVATIARTIAGRPAILVALGPALALEWPRIIEVIQSNPLLYFADRGVPVAAVNPPLDFFGLWPVTPALPFLDTSIASIAVIAVTGIAAVATIVAIAVGNVRLGGTVLVASSGVVVATIFGALPFTHIADQTVGLYTGSLLDPLWFGLLAGLAVLATATPTLRAIAVPGIVVVVAAISAMFIALPFIGGTLVASSAVRSVPAYVEAETRTHPDAGTLVITPRNDSIVAELQRGRGTTFTEWTATAATRREIDSTEVAVATLAGNLIVESGFDVVPAAQELDIRFVLLKAKPTSPAVSAIASHDGLTQVGQTDNGVLWIVNTTPPTTAETPGRNWLYVTGAILAVLAAAIAAIPTSLPRRRIPDDEMVLETEETGA